MIPFKEKFLTLVLFIACSFLSAPLLSAATDGNMAQQDSSRFAALEAKLEEYCKALEHEPVAVQINECDFLIQSCTEPSVRQYVALSLYNHWRSSRLMGAESVAIHILDSWFFNGKVDFNDEIEKMDARIYADFNRNTLIGCKAPHVDLYDMDGSMVSLFEEGECPGHLRVLFFYDASCSKCKIETILLRSLFENEDYPVEFYAIYCGTDIQAWNTYVDEKFEMEPVSAQVRHLWDPTGDSDFQRLYGVIQTPRLFLVAPDGTILGRGLDAKVLAFMLHGIFDDRELEYGSDQTMDMMNLALGGTESDLARPSEEQVRYFADKIAETTLPKGDTLSFRQMSGDLLYCLASNHSQGAREGMKYLIDNYIISRNEIWKSSDDSLKVLGLAGMMNDLLSRSVPGSTIADIAVPAQLQTWKHSVRVERSLRRLRGDNNIIIFYTDGCSVCKAEKAAAKEMISQGLSSDRTLRKAARRTTVLLVNMDEISQSRPDLSSELFDSFDLSSLPYIVITDRKGTVKERYVSLLQ
ncbi:MAG: peroxiredoxin family protein [Candidatus Cryptobacteroides sp.]